MDKVTAAEYLEMKLFRLWQTRNQYATFAKVINLLVAISICWLAAFAVVMVACSTILDLWGLVGVPVVLFSTFAVFFAAWVFISRLAARDRNSEEL